MTCKKREDQCPTFALLLLVRFCRVTVRAEPRTLSATDRRLQHRFFPGLIRSELSILHVVSDSENKLRAGPFLWSKMSGLLITIASPAGLGIGLDGNAVLLTNFGWNLEIKQIFWWVWGLSTFRRSEDWGLWTLSCTSPDDFSDEMTTTMDDISIGRCCSLSARETCVFRSRACSRFPTQLSSLRSRVDDISYICMAASSSLVYKTVRSFSFSLDWSSCMKWFHQRSWNVSDEETKKKTLIHLRQRWLARSILLSQKSHCCV